jgi:hypothetical protein
MIFPAMSWARASKSARPASDSIFRATGLCLKGRVTRLGKLALILLSLLAPTASPRASSHNEVTAWARFFGPWPVDEGGDVASYILAIAAANKSETLVIIEGTCLSACTIKLAAKRRCVRPNAILWFHSATQGPVVSPIGNAVLIDAYPPRVRSEVLRRHMLDSTEFDSEHTLTGRELIKLGEKECAPTAAAFSIRR